MNHKLAGAILLSSAVIVVALGTAGAQIAYAISEAGFHVGRITGVNPPDPQHAYPPWLVLLLAVGLGGIGSVFLFRRSDKRD